ncbi:hypothetical protein O181_027094 [Austropuccinia psidii MF-1]|uniref:Uncharacterized protein n=1 Tax=Austropuccinia psidii MF-1 TaxID=1389203 RepID=A0A9Q3CL93_9BASI|nr:hypothetical protein [Austropuccinia psidii MF-1]
MHDPGRSQYPAYTLFHKEKGTNSTADTLQCLQKLLPNVLSFAIRPKPLVVIAGSIIQICSTHFAPIETEEDPSGLKQVYCQNSAGQQFACSRPTCHPARKSRYNRVIQSDLIFRDCFVHGNKSEKFSSVWPTNFEVKYGLLFVYHGHAIDSRGKKIDINNDIECPWSVAKGLNTMRPACHRCQP